MKFRFWLLLLGILFFLSFSGSVQAYKNYTVGDSLGWYDTLEKPAVNYQKWVAGKNFSLGDFLLFNTDNNHSVIQTFNFSTYKHCNYDDASDNDTTQWSEADPSAVSPHPVTVPVPLLKVGMTYFFSSDYDGEQCQNGQRFKINVTYGQGLPKSLKDAAEEAPAPANPDAGGDESLPENLIPSNINNPGEISDDDGDASDGQALSVVLKLNGGFIVLGLICLFWLG